MYRNRPDLYSPPSLSVLTLLVLLDSFPSIPLNEVIKKKKKARNYPQRDVEHQ